MHEKDMYRKKGEKIYYVDKERPEFKDAEYDSIKKDRLTGGGREPDAGPKDTKK